MDPLDKKIEEVRRIAEDNNLMLRKMKRSMRIATILRVVYWVVVIGLAIGAYYFVQPYIEGAQKFYNDVDTRFTAVDEEFQDNLQNFLNLFKGKEEAQQN